MLSLTPYHTRRIDMVDEWQIRDHEGNVCQSGFRSKEDAENWLKRFKKSARVCDDVESVTCGVNYHG